MMHTARWVCVDVGSGGGDSGDGDDDDMGDERFISLCIALLVLRTANCYYSCLGCAIYAVAVALWWHTTRAHASDAKSAWRGRTNGERTRNGGYAGCCCSPRTTTTGFHPIRLSSGPITKCRSPRTGLSKTTHLRKPCQRFHQGCRLLEIASKAGFSFQTYAP